MPLFFLAAGWVYKEKSVLIDIKRRIQTIVVPYFSFGLLVLLYWQVIERRFRNSDMSFMDSLLGLFSGCYDNLDFNVHLWFLPCFFVTVALFNILVNLGGKKIAYIVSALMSLIYVVLPMPELFWGLNRVFKYIGFYAVGVFLAGRETKIASGCGSFAYRKFLLISLQLNHRAYVVCDSTYWCYCYDSDLSDCQRKQDSAILWSNLFDCSLYPRSRISDCGEDCINTVAQGNRCCERKHPACNDCRYGYNAYLQYGL